MAPIHLTHRIDSRILDFGHDPHFSRKWMMVKTPGAIDAVFFGNDGCGRCSNNGQDGASTR
jgi:hypothetical protein